MKLIKILILFALMLSATSSLSADTLERHSGDAVKSPSVTFDGEFFLTADGKKFSLDEVKKLNLWKKKEVSGRRTFAPEDDGVKALLNAAAKAREKYPHSKYVVLVDHGRYRFNEDATRRYWYRGAFLVNRREALSLANQRLYYEKGRTSAKIISARSISPDGSVVELDRSTVKVVKPSRDEVSFGKGAYLSYTIPGAEIGGIIEFVYEKEEFNPDDKKMFFPAWYFGGEEPVWESVVEITTPREKPMFFAFRNVPEKNRKPEAVLENGFVTRKWTMQNVAPVVPEPLQPAQGDLVPRMEGFSFKDWSYLREWSGKKVGPRMKVTPEIEKKTLEITKNAKTVHEKIEALYYFVQRKIQYLSVKGSLASSMFGHDASQTLKNGYGDCTDKGILFAAMLKVVGVEAYPIWLTTNDGETAINDYPSIGGNHCINEIHLDGKVFYLDATAENFNYRYPTFRTDDHGVDAVNPVLGTVRRIPVPAPEMNGFTYAAEMELYDNLSVLVDMKRTYAGEWEAYFRGKAENSKPEEFERYMHKEVNYFAPGSKLLDYQTRNEREISEPFEWELRFLMPDYPTTADDLVILKMPDVEFNFEEVGLPERKHPVEYASSVKYEYRYTLKIPENLSVEYLPRGVKLANDYADFKGGYTLTGDETINFRLIFRRKARVVPADDYQEYKTFLEKVGAFAEERIFLKKK